MSHKTPRTFAHLFSEPWLITPEKFSEILGFVEARMSGQTISFSSGESAATAYDPTIVETADPSQQGRVCVIPVYGTLVKRGAELDDSGQTGYVALERHLTAAAKDRDVSAIVLDIDTPGGMADGVQGVTNLIRQIDAEVKPVIAHANGCACSAGYYLATGARAIIATEDVRVGSIGVRSVHVDFSKAAEGAGFKFTDLYVGEYKVAGTPHQPLSERDREYIQAHLDDTYTRFVSDVALGRGVTHAVALKWADGRVHNSSTALGLGMVDQIGTLTDAIELAMGETTMNTAELKEQHPETYAEVISLGKAEASSANEETVTAAASAETERCKAIVEIGGTTEMVAEAIDKGTDAGAHAQAVLAHERANPTTAAEEVDPLKGATAAKTVKAEGQEHGDDDAAEAFVAEVNAYCEKHPTVARSRAITACSKLNVEGHAAYLDSVK